MVFCKKNFLSQGSFVVFIFLLSCKNDKPVTQQQQASPPPIVDVIIAQAKTISNVVEVNGTVVANEYVELHSETNGRIVYLNVPEGQYTQEGTVIAKIYDADLQAQLTKAKSQYDIAVVTQERLKKLLDINGINQADYDAAQNDATTQKSEVNRLTALINKTVVKAPFSGVVGLRRLSIGAYVTSADIITTIQQVNKLKIDFTVPEIYAGIIKKGSMVDVQLGAEQLKHKAEIIATEPQINSETRNLVVRALLESGSANPGSFAKVYVNASVDKNSITVPANAIIPDAKNDKLVLIKNNKAVFSDIETGVRDAGTVEIIKGVSAGDTVVVTGVLFARPGKPVQIRNVKDLKDVVQ